MTLFTGQRDHSIDPKDRVVIPSTFADSIRKTSDGVVYLVPSEGDPCVEAYPAAVYEAMARQQVPNRFEGDMRAKRLFFENAERVELKGPGRITLAKRFLPYFPHRKVRIAGLNTYLELWDPATWEKHVAGNGPVYPVPTLSIKRED